MTSDNCRKGSLLHQLHPKTRWLCFKISYYFSPSSLFIVNILMFRPVRTETGICRMGKWEVSRILWEFLAPAAHIATRLASSKQQQQEPRGNKPAYTITEHITVTKTDLSLLTFCDQPGFMSWNLNLYNFVLVLK